MVPTIRAARRERLACVQATHVPPTDLQAELMLHESTYTSRDDVPDNLTGQNSGISAKLDLVCTDRQRVHVVFLKDGDPFVHR